MKPELITWIATLPEEAPELARVEEIRRGRSVTTAEEEPLLSLKEVTAALGYKHHSALWKLGVRQIAEDWAGRPRYRKSEVIRYLKSPECHRLCAERRRARRAKDAKKIADINKQKPITVSLEIMEGDQ